MNWPEFIYQMPPHFACCAVDDTTVCVRFDFASTQAFLRIHPLFALRHTHSHHLCGVTKRNDELIINKINEEFSVGPITIHFYVFGNNNHFRLLFSFSSPNNWKYFNAISVSEFAMCVRASATLQKKITRRRDVIVAKDRHRNVSRNNNKKRKILRRRRCHFRLCHGSCWHALFFIQNY